MIGIGSDGWRSTARRLFQRRSRTPEGQEVDRAALVREVRQIELKARRLVDSHALGAYESIFRGHGIEFSEVRAYQAGDSFQTIDWKVTARMRRPFVKRFVEERELTVLLIVDLSGSTAFGTRGRLKRDLTVEVAGVLCLAAMRSQDRVGLLLFTDHVEKYARPVRGRNRTLCLLYDLLAFQPEGRGTKMALALDTASRLLSVRSLVFVLSDFVAPASPESDGGDDVLEEREAVARSLVGLARHHDVVAIEIQDPAEKRLPKAGLIEVEDPETERRLVVDLSDPGVREGLERRAEAEESELAALLRRSGVEQLRLSTDRPYTAELYAFFASRVRRRRVGPDTLARRR